MAANEIGYEQIEDLLDSNEHWFLLSHVKPDGDTLGAASAFFCSAKEKRKRVSWAGVSDVPVAYNFLPNIEFYSKSGWIDLDTFENGHEPLFICLDTSTLERTVGGLHPLWTILNIDHHADNHRYGTYCHIQSKISSVCELVWDFMKKRNWNIASDTATGLYTGIMTDSGNFSYNSTRESTHMAAADLISRGVDPSSISLSVNGNKSIDGVHLWGIAMSRVRYIGEDGKIAFSYLSLDDFYSTGAKQSDTEFLVSQLLLIHGVEFAILMSEDAMETRVSLRSVKGGVSAGMIARQLGGGGHELAAGVLIRKPLKDVIPLVLSNVETAYAERNPTSE